MTQFRKVLAIASAAAIVATQAMSAVVYWATATFDPEFASALNWMNTNGLTKYSTEDAFRPYDTLTREQAAKFFVEFAKKTGKTPDTTLVANFSDLDKADASLKPSIIESYQLGLMNGSNGKFMPTVPFTKAAAITVLVRTLVGKQDESVSPWWDNYFIKARELGLTKETNSKALDRSVLRGEVALMLYRSANGSSTTTSGDSDLGDLLSGLLGGGSTTTSWSTTTTTDSTSTGTTTTTTTDTVAKAGSLEVALNPASPAAKSVPYAGTVVFGSFDLKAGSSDISVNTIKLSREGLGQRSDISRVWMEKAGTRITSRQTVASDNTVVLSFSPALVVKAGSSETLDLAVTLSGTTNSQHRFTLVSADDVTSSAESVAGTFPVSTNVMTTSSYSVAPVAFATWGTTSSYKVADTNVELGQFKLTNNATNDMSVLFKSVTLRNEGNGDVAKSLSNLAVYKGSTKVSSDVKVDGKYVTFTVSDTVAFGRQETYYIRGDISSVDNTSGDTYQFSLRYSDDLNVVEDGTLFKARITGADSAVNLVSYTVQWGEIILSKSNNSTSQTVAPGSNDVVLLSADLKASQPINLSDLVVTLNSSAGYSGTLSDLASAFSSLKLKVGNNVVSTYTPASAGTSSFTFEGTFTVSSNTTIQILGNVKSTSSGKFLLNDLDASDFGTREYASNGNSISTSQFVGSAQWSVTTIGAATLTFTRNDGISNQTLVVGAKDQTLAQFIVRANDVSDVTVTRLKFGTGSSSSGSFNTSYVTNVRMYVNGDLKSTKSMSSNYADFNDISVKVAKNSDVTVKLVADFSSSITNNQQFNLALSSSEVEARDANGVTLSLSPSVSGPVYTFTSAGSATVSLNSSSPTAKLLAATGTEVEVARYTFAATNDSLKLTDLYVYNAGTADLSSRVKTISLYDVNGNKLAGGSVLATGLVSFSLGNTSTFVVAKNSSNTVAIVKASFNDITDGSSTNTTVALSVGTGSFSATTVDGAVNGVRLVSESVGNTVSTVTLSSATSATHKLVRSKPVVATTAAATNSTHTFAVTADATNRIVLTGLTLSIANPVSGPTTWTLYKDLESNGNEVATFTFTGWTVTVSFNDWVEISAGSTRTFIISLAWAGAVSTNAKRIVRVTDMNYYDKMDTGSDANISSVSAYSNVGLPTAESTFTY